MCSTPRAARKVEAKSTFPPWLSCSQIHVCCLEHAASAGEGVGAPEWLLPSFFWAPLVGTSLIPILVVSKKGCALGYLGIYGFSGEAQH